MERLLSALSLYARALPATPRYTPLDVTARPHAGKMYHRNRQGGRGNLATGVLVLSVFVFQLALQISRLAV